MVKPAVALTLSVIAGSLAAGCPLEGQCTEGADRGSDGKCRWSDAGRTRRDTGPSDSGLPGDGMPDGARDGGTPDTGDPCAACPWFCNADGACETAVAVAAGTRSTCVVTSEGRVFCWGANDVGQLGSGDMAPESTTPVLVRGVVDVLQVAVGDRLVCALGRDRRIACWGANWEGRLGAGRNPSELDRSYVPLPVVGVTDAAEIGVGAGGCARRTSGAVVCWGGNMFGQVGNGTTADAWSPAETGLTGIRGIAVGGLHACAFASSGSAYCWGAGSYGQLGVGDVMGRTRPEFVPGLDEARQIGAGSAHTCLVEPTVTSCWGENSQGQIGDGTASGRMTPTMVPGHVFVSVEPGYLHTCATKADASLWCWGANEAGQLGIGAIGGLHYAPEPVDLPPVSSFSAGNLHSCAVVDGTPYCWGEGANGRLGDGTGALSETPVRVVAPSL